jgi:hypothetical protein
MTDDPNIDRRPIISARRLVSASDLYLARVDAKAHTFSRLTRELLETHPDADVSTVRLEERAYTFPGDKDAGLDCRITARKGLPDA